MRLPRGFRRLRDDLGAIIRAYRRGDRGTGYPVAPKVFASNIGISRGALSRIENERAWPGPDTLSRIMDAFEIDWPVVAEVGENLGPHLKTPNTWQEGQRANLCTALRQGRQELGWTLAELARRSGLSASQLSRIERGQIARSAVLTLESEDFNILEEDRRVVFAHPLLMQVATGQLGQEVGAEGQGGG
ncbi:helix-turn-helix domain-containing protein [Sphingomonas trueperi]|uniref:helix-turn-helix domain-containing protein n=1 Tax=Sphingomonas trueperi TaxID=53317 RepID=UPI001600D96F